MTTIPKKCETCGAAVEMRSGAGRSHEYRRDLALPVPDAFEIPTCVQCGEIYLNEDGYRALADAQKPAFLEWQKKHLAEVIDTIKSAHGVRLRDVERAADVTATYLSHLLGGRNEASQTLINLLEAFALHPGEFQRKLRGKSWEAAKIATMQMPSKLGAYKGTAIVVLASQVAAPQRAAPPPYVMEGLSRNGWPCDDPMALRKTA